MQVKRHQVEAWLAFAVIKEARVDGVDFEKGNRHNIKSTRITGRPDSMEIWRSYFSEMKSCWRL